MSSFSPARATTVSQRLLRMAHFVIAHWYLRKPDLRDLLEIKFPDFSSVAWAAANELNYRLRRSHTARILSLNIETTNYCNLACTICPVNRGMVRKKLHLDPALFRSLIDRTPGLKFILPFQWGEPLLHPEMESMIRYAADRGIRSMLTTNGTLLDGPRCEKLLHSGLARLTVSVDGDEETHRRIRGVELSELREAVAELKRRRDAGRHALRIDVSMVLDDVTRRAIEHYRQAWHGVVDRVQVIPRLAQARRTQACREPWRGSLVVLVDGTVTPCCADSEGELALGNAHQEAPAAILNNAAFQELRRCHRRGEFPGPCRDCAEYDGADVGVSTRFS